MTTPFYVLESSSREEWLEQRRGFLTATDAVRLKNPTHSNLRAIHDDKANPPKFRGNAYTNWGHEREPVIADYVRNVLGIDAWPNEKLHVSNVYDGMAATPDMVASDGSFSVQIKTIKADKAPTNIDDFMKKHPEYEAQLEWEMLVLGIDSCFFCWELRHGKPGDFTPGEIYLAEYKSDSALRQRLLDGLEAYENFTPDEIQEGADDFEVQYLVSELARLSVEKAKISAQKTDVEKELGEVNGRLLELFGTDPVRRQFSQGVVEVVPGRRSSTFDRKGFAKEYPDLEARFTNIKEGAPSIKFKAA